MSEEITLRLVMDQMAIQQTIARYIEAASRADVDVVGSTYADEGIWELPAFDLKVVGREAIKAKIVELLAPMEYLVQLGSPAVIQVKGDHATARSTIREGCKFKDKNVAGEILGIYDDDLIRTAEGWQFSRRTFHMNCFNTYDVHSPQEAA